MNYIVFVLFALIAMVWSQGDPCSEIPTCEECVAHTFCGWCSEFVIFDNGKRGRNCAYQGADATPFVCPKFYQTETCIPEEYICNNVTFQCQPVDFGSGGISIEDCVKSCFPPTWVCNEQRMVCEEGTPGTGTSFEVCNATCGQAPEQLYICNRQTLECEEAKENDPSGTTMEVCEATCGKASNDSVPAFIRGIWRGIQINVGYTEDEWRAVILEDNSIMIEDPSGSVFAAGALTAMQNELWIENSVGLMRGIYSPTHQPTVIQLTWAIGNPGEPVPINFEVAMMKESPANVFVFWKCLDGQNCEFKSSLSEAMKKRIAECPHAAAKPVHKVPTPTLKQKIEDKCSIHPDCETCIADKANRCGWCDINVLYRNGTIEGTQCAGHNADGTKDPFICNSVYSTETCDFPTADDTADPDTNSQSDSEDQQNWWTCNPTNFTCEERNGGTFEFKVDCEQQCVRVPVPLDLIGTWRGIEISNGYEVGEWRAEITENKVAIAHPDGSLSLGNTYTAGQYLVLDIQQGQFKGKITTIWQLSFAPVTRNLAWAWSKPGGEAPSSFQEGMKKPHTSFVMVACGIGKDRTVCDFTF